MTNSTISKKSYFELAEHDTIQKIVFILIMSAGILFIFSISLPVLSGFFEDFLNGRVFNSGEMVSYSIDTKDPQKETDYLLSWAVDIYIKSPEEARYWFNPLLSIFLPATIFGLAMAIFSSSLLPGSLGFIRQKIEREIANSIDKISVARTGEHSEENQSEIIDEILHADLRLMRDYSEMWGISIEDLKMLNKALKWYSAGFLYRIIHFNDGFRIYMRSYFTVNYSNTVLGLVYIGAAVLIIIIGLRGLKFIPPTQPSLVIFALGLEFSLLITYATTLMYSKEEDTESEQKSGKQDTTLLGSDFGNQKEVESLLRVFIKSNKDKDT